MKCPNCKTEISENENICPTCKKVVKIKCPNCGEMSSKSVCNNCGTVLLNKCYKCGKINLSSAGVCPSCGLDINASIGLRESVIEEFAVLTIEITNFEEIKEIFNSDKIKEQFKQNFFNFIKKAAAQKKLRVQLLQDTFIIRFNKQYSFTESCQAAVEFSLFVAQTISQINQKLFDAKGAVIRAQMAIQSRDIYAKNDEYKSGINISVVYSSLGSSRIYDNVETVVDYYVYQEIKNEYPLQSLCAVYLKNQMVMFFELMLAKILKTNENKVAVKKMELPQAADFVPEEEEDEDLINFSGLHCSFVRSRGETLLSKLKAIKNVQNPIVSIKKDKKYDYLSTIETKQLEEIFEDYSVIRLSCTKNQKYSVYGLLKQILLSCRNSIEEEVLLDSDKVLAVTENTYLRNMLELRVHSQVHPEDSKFSYYEAFSLFIKSIPFKTMFVIEDFHNVDETSLEILKYVIENEELGNVGFIVSNDKDWSLHRKIYSLMTSDNYAEIELKPSSNKTILNTKAEELKRIQNSFFVEKVCENTKGSYLYFEQALRYLTDENVLEYNKSKYSVKEERMLVIPADFDELIQKRLSHFKRYQNAFELFGSMLLFSEKIPIEFIYNLEIEHTKKILAYFEKKRFIENVENRYVVIKNYNLFRENFIKICDEGLLQQLAQNLLDKIYINISVPNSKKAELLEFAKLKKEAFTQWHSLAMISSQIGDFCAYLNNTNRFLSLVDTVLDEDTNKNVDQIKIDVYSELASMLYKYYPDKIIAFLEMILKHFEEQNDNQKVKEIANKLVQSCIISGNYSNALEAMGKIIARTQRGSFNPQAADFNLNYFLTNLVLLELYFNLGRLKECEELGEELFKNIDFINFGDNLLPEGFSRKQFEDALMDGLFFVYLSGILQLKTGTREKLAELKMVSEEYKSCFGLLSLILDFFEGKDITPAMTDYVQAGLCGKYSQILFPFLQGMIALKYKDWDKFGNYIYNAKLKVAELQLHQFNYYCDLLIGYAYQNRGNFKKAKQIYYSVVDIATEKGMKNILYVAWFLIAKSEAQENNLELAENILNNSILKSENDANVSVLYSVLLKSFLAQVILSGGASQNSESALVLAEQAFTVALNNKLYFYMPQIVDILLFLYNQIVQTEQNQKTVQTYQKKIVEVQQIVSQIFSNQN